MISPGADALTCDRLHHVDQSYVLSETLTAATAELFQARAGIGLAQLWGGGLLAAGPNPKYFGRNRGITWLNMLDDQFAGLAAEVVSGRQHTREGSPSV
ncbi:transposase [Nocardia paucivorans]|uniref:transposase n=1 Tax=Nocardia paucivorans TaxID=114259 RepID=UPI001FE0F8CB|nr:transposase [Nocardia paucivorans]